MTHRRSLAIATSLLALTICAPMVRAQDAQPSTFSQEDGLRIVKEVQKQLGNLTNFGVFDWLTFGIHGKTLVLKGYASRPSLKDDAERVIKGIPGIDSVDNQIEVLPLSPNDDRIRAAVYNRIFTNPSLRKYNANAGALGRGLSVARMAGGITNDPPFGFHAIHIVVKSGNVILYGVVLNSMDSAIAEMQANTAPGTFSVDNDLVVEHAAAKPITK
jgi:hyperosmotically inducible protein